MITKSFPCACASRSCSQLVPAISACPAASVTSETGAFGPPPKYLMDSPASAKCCFSMATKMSAYSLLGTHPKAIVSNQVGRSRPRRAYPGACTQPAGRASRQEVLPGKSLTLPWCLFLSEYFVGFEVHRPLSPSNIAPARCNKEKDASRRKQSRKLSTIAERPVRN